MEVVEEEAKAHRSEWLMGPAPLLRFSALDSYSWIGGLWHLHKNLICQATVMAILDFKIPTKSSQ